MSGRFDDNPDRFVYRVNTTRRLGYWALNIPGPLYAPNPVRVVEADGTEQLGRGPVHQLPTIGSSAQRGGPMAPIIRCAYGGQSHLRDERYGYSVWQGAFRGFQEGEDGTGPVSNTELVLCSDFRSRIVIIGVGRNPRNICERWMVASFNPVTFSPRSVDETHIRRQIEYLTGEDDAQLEARIVIVNCCEPRRFLDHNRQEFSRAFGQRDDAMIRRDPLRNSFVQPESIAFYEYAPGVRPLHRDIGIGSGGLIGEGA